MKTSIVMTTYNGEKYIVAQLNSLKNQSRSADEILIFDDNSNDRTVDLIREFISNNQLSTWKLIINQPNKGWKRNFIEGFTVATGDLIFPCDQDDIWEEDKIAKMLDIMDKDKDKDILVLATNYIPFYETDDAITISNTITKTMSDNKEVKKAIFDEKMMHVLRPGCTFCFRKSFFQQIESLWTENHAHDAFLWRYAQINDGLYIYNSPTIKFRRHDSNATNNDTLSLKNNPTAMLSMQNDNFQFHQLVLEELKSYILSNSVKGKNEKLNLIAKNLEFLNLRSSLLNNKNIFAIIKLLFYYRKFYLTVRSFLGDIYITIKS